MSNLKTTIFILGALLFFTAGGILLEQSESFVSAKKAISSPSVPSGFLNYGTMGKILKQLGVVLAVPNDNKRFFASQEPEPDMNATLFRRKRYVGKYLFKANPGGFNAIPSSLAVPKEELQKGWPVLSIVVDGEDLYSKKRGIVSNFKGRGRNWERFSYMSYFEDGHLLFATAAGLRLHGGASRKRKVHNFRLYFRDDYGASQFKPGLLFSPGAEPLKRLVVRKDTQFITLLAFDIATRIGEQVPGLKPALFILNGKYRGTYSLTEHLVKNQWINHLGHDNFIFYRFKGPRNKEARTGYKKLKEWAFRFPGRMSREEAGKYVNMDNFSRHMFSNVFCGAIDWAQGAAVLDKNAEKPKWSWINWDIDNSFIDYYNRFKLKTNRKAWEQEAFELVLEPRTYWWWEKNEYLPIQKRSARFILFRRLWKEDPGFHNYFSRLVMDILNHKISPDYLESRVDFYEKMARAARGGDYNSPFKAFVKHRPGFIRKQMQQYFNTGESMLCQVRSAPHTRLKIDGYPEQGIYQGHYFKGETITVEYLGPHSDLFSCWLVNGKKHTTQVLVCPVNQNTVISPVMKDETLLIEAAEKGDAGAVRTLLEKNSKHINYWSEMVKRFTFLAVIEAVKRGHEQVVKVLLEKGADIHAEVEKNVSLVTYALICNQPKVVKILKAAGAVFSLEKIKESDELIDRFINNELKSPGYKEMKVWYPFKKSQEKISPALYSWRTRGKFDFDFEKEGKRNCLIVFNSEADKKDRRSIQFGYSANRKSLKMKIPGGFCFYFIAKVKVSNHLINENNFLYIQDFDGKKEREIEHFRSENWQTYMVAKKVRTGSTKLYFGFNFEPGSPGEKLMIKDIKIFVSKVKKEQ